MTTASGLFLVLGIVCYGIAGSSLHSGANSERGALRSRAWWVGTALQAAGFLSMLVARVSLPLLLVQAGSSAGLAVTAGLQHVSHVRRLRPTEGLAVLGVIAGLAAIAATTSPGPASVIQPQHLWLLAGGSILGLVLMIPRLPALGSGIASGLGFSLGGIGARLVLGDHTHSVWQFWQLPLQNWACGILAVVGIVIGQVHLTRGLSRAQAAPVLGTMYLVATVGPAVIGATMLQEVPRSGTLPLALAGLLVAGLGIYQLLRRTTPAELPIVVS